MREPDIHGPVGRAWLLEKLVKTTPSHDACLASWLVNRPGVHPWSWWLVSLIHLRELPNVKAPFKRYPEAEYEFLICTIDPQLCAKPDPDSSKGYPLLAPMDIVEQFHGVSDSDANRICEASVRTILSGGLDPDQAHQPFWHHKMRALVAAYGTGKRPMN
jgi:hypothetical protein